MNEERDKFLTEAMGLCWHDCYNYLCRHCEKMFPDSNNNFSTWEGFGKLLEWAGSKYWFATDFTIWVDTRENKDANICQSRFVSMYLMNPDRFANAIYEYLINRGSNEEIVKNK